MSVLTAKGELWVRTGETCYPYAGQVSGADWIASGNALSGPTVVEAMAEAMEGGRDRTSPTGCCRRSRRAAPPAARGTSRRASRCPSSRPCSTSSTARSPMAVTDLRVDYDPSAVEQLRRLYEHVQPLDWYFPVMWDRPWDLLDEAAARGAFNDAPLG